MAFDVTLARSIDFDRRSCPILFEIASAYEKFVGCFGRIGNNLLEVPIFSNPSIARSLSDRRSLDIAFFGKEFYDSHKDALRKLTTNDCMIAGRLKNIDEFREMNLPFSIKTWMVLRSALILAKKEIAPSDNQLVTLDRFLRGIKKGSKKFREVIDRLVYQSRTVLDLTTVIGFARITETQTPNLIITKNFASGWACTVLDNDFREFIFKCRNNMLRTGDRLLHMLLYISDTCNLRLGLLPGMKHRETFLHLYRTCPVVSTTLLRLNVRCKLNWDINNCYFDSVYWYGDCAGNLDRNVLLFYDIFRYQIWAMKIRRIFDTKLLIENEKKTARCLNPENWNVIDLTQPGLRINSTSINKIMNKVSDLSSRVDIDKATVVLQLFDNSVFMVGGPGGEKRLPGRDRAGTYHIDGSLIVADRTVIKDLVTQLAPLLKALGASRKIILTPLARYWVGPCCGDPAHLINYHTAGYLPKLGDAIAALRDAIRDALFVKKIQNFRVLCPNKMVGVEQRREEPIDEEAAKTAALWDPDPVHPTGAAYRVIAEALETDAANPDARYTNPGKTAPQSKKLRYDPSLHREGWVSGCSAALQRRDSGPPKLSARGFGGPPTTRGHQARYRGRSLSSHSSGGSTCGTYRGGGYRKFRGGRRGSF